MRFNRHIAIPILTGIAGCLLGGVIASRYWLKDFAETDELRKRVEVVYRIRLLRQLRSNKNNEAIAEQEITLAGDIVGLANAIKFSSLNHTDSVNALNKAATYHKQYPLSSIYPELNKAIDQALSFAKH